MGQNGNGVENLRACKQAERESMKQLRILPTLITKLLIQLTYSLTSLFIKVNPNKVTLATYRSSVLEGNLLYVKNEIHALRPEIECRVLARKFNSSLPGKARYVLHLLRASYHLATSRYFIIDDYYFPVYAVQPRKGTEVVQLWHAAGAFKKFGLSLLNKNFGPSREYLEQVKIHSNYGRVYVSSKEVIPYYAEAFGMDEQDIYPLGVARTDYFFKKGSRETVLAKIHQLFPDLVNKQLILYAPTFRGKSHYQTAFDIPLDAARMKRELQGDYALLVHLHPYMNKGVRFNPELDGFVYLTNGAFTVEELLLAADILITDYSSIIFDYSLLNKPIAFFAHDYESYLKERDFYYSFESFVPGPIFTETGEMIEWISRSDKDIEAVAAFSRKFFDYTDGNASARIVRHLFE